MRMAKSIPTKNSAMDAGKTSIAEGAYLGVGEALGEAVLGEGAGTLAGGALAAASESGTSRDRMATIAGERAVQSILSGASGGGSSGGRQRM